jgi:hypothetical protein
VERARGEHEPEEEGCALLLAVCGEVDRVLVLVLVPASQPPHPFAFWRV